MARPHPESGDRVREIADPLRNGYLDGASPTPSFWAISPRHREDKTPLVNAPGPLAKDC